MLPYRHQSYIPASSVCEAGSSWLPPLEALDRFLEVAWITLQLGEMNLKVSSNRSRLSTRPDYIIIMFVMENCWIRALTVMIDFKIY